MLACKYCCRHKISHLLSILYCLKGCPYGNLRLTISNISTYKP